MTPEELRSLIDGGETLNVEFKGEEHSPLNDHDLVEAVVCLANRPGSEPGWLLVGVEDDGRITGARPRPEAGHTDPARVTAVISNRTRPSLAVRVFLVPIEGVEVLAIEIPRSRIPLSTTDGRYLRRALGGDGRPACVPMQFHEMQALQADRGLLDYSVAVIPGASWGDLDPLEIERFRREIIQRTGDELVFSYRESSLSELVILGAEFELTRGQASNQQPPCQAIDDTIAGEKDETADGYGDCSHRKRT